MHLLILTFFSVSKLTVEMVPPPPSPQPASPTRNSHTVFLSPLLPCSCFTKAVFTLALRSEGLLYSLLPPPTTSSHCFFPFSENYCHWGMTLRGCECRKPFAAMPLQLIHYNGTKDCFNFVHQPSPSFALYIALTQQMNPESNWMSLQFVRTWRHLQCS